MKIKTLSLLALCFIICISCDRSDDTINRDNPNLIDPLVNLNLNLNLPEYSDLNFPGNGIIITSQGVRGISIYNVNNDLYTAFELSDPNHQPNNCSLMSVEGIIATCPCDDGNSYDIVTGQHRDDPDLFPLQAYRIVRTGNTLRVTN